MVTPRSLYGAGCATAVDASSIEAKNRKTNLVVFIELSS
jgi:hypothetical protein